MMMEEGRDSSVSEVGPMMLLVREICDRGRGDTTIIDDNLFNMFKQVYMNFTLIHTAAISLLENCRQKFHQDDLPNPYRWLRHDLGVIITFCRCQLNEDGVINNSSALLLLEKIESSLLIIVKALTKYLSRGKLDPSKIKDLRRDHIVNLSVDIEPVYEAIIISRHEMPSYLPIGSKFILEFINQLHQDLHHWQIDAREERKTMGGYLLVLRYYLEYVMSTDGVDGEEMNNFLISSQLVASKMAYYSFFTYYTYRATWERKFASIRHHIESDIRVGCLRAALLLPQHVSSSIPTMNSELLIAYLNCIHDNLSDLLKDEAFSDLTSPMIDQFKIFQRGLLFMKYFLASYVLNDAVLEKLSDIRVRIHALVRFVGSLIISCFNNEMNGSLTPLLSDFIENVNLMNKEGIEIMDSSVTAICGKMYRLHPFCSRGETSDNLHQKFKDVYQNFTSIHTTAISLLENCGKKFHRGSSDLPYQYRWLRQELGLVITFCRCQLNWMVNEDGLMVNEDWVINNSSALLLAKIEGNLLIVVKALTEYLSREKLDLSEISDLMVEHIANLSDEIEPEYQAIISRHEMTVMPSYLLIGSKFILEFINQVHQDLQHKQKDAVEERKTMEGYLLLLRYYLEYMSTTMDRVDGEEMNDFLISSQLVASKMAYYSFFTRYTYRAAYWNGKFASIRHRIESDIRLGCLRAALLLPQHVSSSIPAMNSELLIAYLNCIHDNLSDFREDKAFIDLTSQITNQFTDLPRGIQ